MTPKAIPALFSAYFNAEIICRGKTSDRKALYYGKGSDDAEKHVLERAVLLLEGKVDLKVQDHGRNLEDGSLSAADSWEMKRKQQQFSGTGILPVIQGRVSEPGLSC